jgi:hypothetical protein
MHTEFDDLFKTENFSATGEVLPVISKDVPDFVPLDGKPDPRMNRAVASLVLGDELSEILGTSPSPEWALSGFDKEYQQVKKVTAAQPTQTIDVDAMCKAAGKPGEKLKKMLLKGSYSLTEGMDAMLNSFKEFFSDEEVGLLKRAIDSLDLPAFFQLMNSRVYAGGL